MKLGAASRALRPHRKSSHSDSTTEHLTWPWTTPLQAEAERAGFVVLLEMTMSNSDKPAESFFAVAQESGLRFAGLAYRRAPLQLAEHLTQRLKRTAKLVRSIAGIPHHTALDVAARAGRFNDWQHLSRHLSKTGTAPESFRRFDWAIQAISPENDAEFGRAPLNEAWFLSLSGLLPILVVSEGVSQNPEARRAFERFARALAEATGQTDRRILDAVCAPLVGCPSWDEATVLHNPWLTQEPLYQFEVRNDGALGSLRESADCRLLVDELDDKWQGYPEFSAPRKASARAWVEKHLEYQPGFLEAGLARAQMYADEPDPLSKDYALRLVTNYVRQAESLVPRGFTGEIPWGAGGGNAAYLRMLWLQADLYQHLGDYPKAVATWRKTLRRDRRDGLGARHNIALGLLAQGDIAGAKRALRPFSKESGLLAAAIRGFVAHALGDQHGFRQQMLEALFTWPMLRGLLDERATSMPAGESGTRGAHLDMDAILEIFWSAYYAVSGLEAACLELINETAVIQAESVLREAWSQYFGSALRPNSGPVPDWPAEVSRYAEYLAKAEASPEEHA